MYGVGFRALVGYRFCRERLRMQKLAESEIAGALGPWGADVL